MINGSSIIHVLHFDSNAFLTNLLLTNDNVYICIGAICVLCLTYTQTHLSNTFCIKKTLMTSTSLFVVCACVLRHQTRPAVTPNDQGVAAGSPQAAHLSPRGSAEL